MTAEIVWESSTLCRTLWWGMVFAAEYDTIRIFRRIVNHNMLVIMVLEDMAYWIYVSIKIFSICFYVNDGVIRAFIIAGFIMGAGLYVKALSRYYIKYGVKLISFFIKIVSIIIIKPLKFILSMVRMISGKLLFPVKLCCRYIKSKIPFKSDIIKHTKKKIINDNYDNDISNKQS